MQPGVDGSHQTRCVTLQVEIAMDCNVVTGTGPRSEACMMPPMPMARKGESFCQGAVCKWRPTQPVAIVVSPGVPAFHIIHSLEVRMGRVGRAHGMDDGQRFFVP